MLQFPIRSVVLLATAALSLSACSTYGPGYGGGYGVSGVSIGYGSGYSPYYGGYARPYYGAGYGWYDGSYYPGYGSYIYNRHGYRSSWNYRHRNYWQGGGIGSAGHGGFVGLPRGFGSNIAIGSHHRRGHLLSVRRSHRSVYHGRGHKSGLRGGH